VKALLLFARKALGDLFYAANPVCKHDLHYICARPGMPSSTAFQCGINGKPLALKSHYDAPTLAALQDRIGNCCVMV
jgi:hypothetical protein